MRYVRPGLLVFFVALLASLSVHLPVYQVLGTLSERWRAEVPPPQAPAEIEFELAERNEPEEPSESPPDEPEPEDEPVSKPEPEERPEAPRQVTIPKKPEPPKPVETPEPAVPVQPVPRNRLAVEQRSDDPDVEPPPDAEYIAEENRRVLEETVASVTNLARDEEPQQGAPAMDPDPGNAADEDEVAEMERVDSESRVPQEGEAEVMRPQSAGPVAEGEAKPARAVPRPAAEQKPPGAAQLGGGAPASEPAPLVIHDGDGTLVIRRPAVKPSEDRKSADSALPGGPGRPGERVGAADLTISQRQFAELYGEARLRRDREAYMAQRKSKAVGGDRSRRWRKFRAAIENYVTRVRPGEQTALNAAASPFAAYLATIHRRIHAEFALGFLRNISLKGGPLSDPNLRTRLEIIINGDGSLHQVGIIETSGVLPFDFGAFDAVSRAAPFTKPPSNILSADGRVYLHWGFHRDMRQCGTFNASPFILRGDDLRPKIDDRRPIPQRKGPILQHDTDSEMGGLPGAAPRSPRGESRARTFN